MTEEEDVEMDGYSSSSSNMWSKKTIARGKFKSEQEISSKTSSLVEPSSSSLVVLHGGDDQAATDLGENKISQSSSTRTEYDTDPPSKTSHDFTTTLVSASALQYVHAVTNFIDEGKNPNVTDVEINAAADAHDTMYRMVISEACEENTKKLLEKDIMTISNHSRSDRRHSGSTRKTRSRTLSDSSHSLGSPSISHSSHISISAHTMASSLDTIDSDLDSLDSEDNCFHELPSDNSNDDFYHQDQPHNKHRQFLSSSDDEDNNIGECDASWWLKSQYNQLKASNKLSVPPSLSYLSRYSASDEELHNKTTDKSELIEPTTILDLPPITPVGERSTKLLLPTPDPLVNEIWAPSLIQQQPQTNLPKEDIPFVTASLKENGDFEGNNSHADHILTNSVPISKGGQKESKNNNEHLLREIENNGVKEPQRDQVVPTEQQLSFSEKDPEIGEQSDESFFPPCEEPKSSGSHEDLNLAEIHQKQSMGHCQGERAMQIPSSFDDSKCLMEYSISHCSGGNAPIDTNRSHQLEKFNLSSSVRIRRCIIRGLCTYLTLLTCGLTLYFFAWFDNNTDQKSPTQIDPLFPIDLAHD